MTPGLMTYCMFKSELYFRKHIDQESKLRSKGLNLPNSHSCYAVSYLHCYVITGGWHALQHLITAAPGAACQHYAGRYEDVFHFFRILLYNLHKELPWFTQTLVVHLH